MGKLSNLFFLLFYFYFLPSSWCECIIHSPQLFNRICFKQPNYSKNSFNVDPNDASIQNINQSEFSKSSPAPSFFLKETIDIQYFIRNHLKGLLSKPHLPLNFLFHERVNLLPILRYHQVLPK